MPKRRANGEGNIRKRKDGRWEGRYTAGYDQTGKRIIKNVLGKTQAEVKEKLKAAISKSQRLDVSKAGNYTVASWVRTWYEVYAEPRIRPNTKSYYTNYILHREPHHPRNWGRPAGQADHQPAERGAAGPPMDGLGCGEQNAFYHKAGKSNQRGTGGQSAENSQLRANAGSPSAGSRPADRRTSEAPSQSISVPIAQNRNHV